MINNWLNYGDAFVVAYLIAINVAIAKKGVVPNFRSKHRIINFIEQVGRYASMLFMVWPSRYHVKPITALLWVIAMLVLLLAYTLYWRKNLHKKSTLHALATLPILIFMFSGLLQGKVALVIAAVIFAIGHLAVLKENVRTKKSR